MAKKCVSSAERFSILFLPACSIKQGHAVHANCNELSQSTLSQHSHNKFNAIYIFLAPSEAQEVKMSVCPAQAFLECSIFIFLTQISKVSLSSKQKNPEILCLIV